MIRLGCVKFTKRHTIVELIVKHSFCAQVCFFVHSKCKPAYCVKLELEKGKNIVRGPPLSKRVCVTTVDCRTYCFDLNPPEPCVSPAQRTQFAFDYPNWRPDGVPLFQTNGVAELNQILLSLGTAPSSAWYPVPISPASFQLQFTFTIGQVIQGGVSGFAVVVQNQGVQALGTDYGYIGIGGRSGAIVFDPLSQQDSSLRIFALRDSNATPIAPTSVPPVVGNTWTAWLRYDFCSNLLTLFLEEGLVTAAEPSSNAILQLQLSNKTIVNNTLIGFTANNVHATVTRLVFK